ncbi:MAG TPA: hypothetical protein VKC90_12640 [Chitinophagaceae bacterium]|nr:hypothetical protein [Chitinophagaceae bacterium]
MDVLILYSNHPAHQEHPEQGGTGWHNLEHPVHLSSLQQVPRL